MKQIIHDIILLVWSFRNLTFFFGSDLKIKIKKEKKDEHISLFLAFEKKTFLVNDSKSYIFQGLVNLLVFPHEMCERKRGKQLKAQHLLWRKMES